MKSQTQSRLFRIKIVYYTGLSVFLVVSCWIAWPYLHLHLLQREEVVPHEIGTFDSILGWKLKPSSSAISKRTGHEILYRINENGQRAIDNSSALSDCRVVALGDSNTFGFGISIEDHWLTQLKKYFPAFEIYNLGVNGYGVDQELLRFRLEGAALKPRLVLAYVKHFSDDRHMKAILWSKAKPYFLQRADGELVLHTEHIQQLNGHEPSIDLGYTDMPKQKHELGIRIIQEMQKEAIASGSRFLLLAGWQKLCDDSGILHCLNVSRVSNYPVISTAGENLQHLNAEGSGILASLISDYVNREHLLPKECMKGSAKKF